MATLQDYLGITKLRDAWPKWKANVIAVNNQVIAHVAGTADKHAAQDITYTGDFTGKTEVKAALDQAKTEIDLIVVSASIDPEVAFARESLVKAKTFGTLDARLEESEQDFVSAQADNATLFEQNSLIPFNVFKNSEVNLVLCGIDSLTSGAGASVKYLDYFRSKMYSAFEYGGPGYIAFDYEVSVTDTQYFNMGFDQFSYIAQVAQGVYPALYSLDNKGMYVGNAINAYINLEIKTRWTKGKIFYLIQPGGGSFNIGYLSDLTATNQHIDCNGTLELGVITLPDNKASYGGNVSITLANGKIAVFGGLFTNVKGVCVSRLGKGGDTLAYHNATDSTFRAKWLYYLKPNLLVLNAGTNDGTVGDAYKTILDQYTTSYAAAGTHISLVRAHDMSVGTWPKNDETVSFAKTKKYSLINQEKVLGSSYDDAVLNGFMFDGVHPNTNGNKKIANHMLKYLGVPILNDELSLIFNANVGAGLSKVYVHKLIDKFVVGNGNIALGLDHVKIYDLGLTLSQTGKNTYGIVDLQINAQVIDATGMKIKVKRIICPIANTNTTTTNLASVDPTKLIATEVYPNVDFDFTVTAEVLDNRVVLKVNTIDQYYVGYTITGAVFTTNQYNLGGAVYEN